MIYKYSVWRINHYHYAADIGHSLPHTRDYHLDRDQIEIPDYYRNHSFHTGLIPDTESHIDISDYYRSHRFHIALILDIETRIDCPFA